MVLCNVECVQKISQYLGASSRSIYIDDNNVLDKTAITLRYSKQCSPRKCEIWSDSKNISNVSKQTKKIGKKIMHVISSDNIVKNQTIQGFSTIVQVLVKNSGNADLLGKDKVELALVRQWLEYTVLYLNYADLPANSRRIFKELNVALQKNTYICGTSLTVADVALYYGLHSIMKGLTHQEKAEYVNVSRWFDNVQQNEKLRQKLDLINFDSLYLYL